MSNEDLIAAHFLVLRTLWDADGLTQTELAQHLAMDPPHVTATLNQMARKNLIRRERHREDGRKVNVRLTAKSRAMKTRLLPKLAPINEIAGRGIARRDLDVMHRVLAQMTTNLEDHAAAQPTADRNQSPGIGRH